MKKLKIVTLGGGTGTFAVLSALKKFPQLDLTAVVNMTDSGGSTGRLRDEFGMLPVGDARLSMVALAREDDGSNVLRELFNYRFPDSNSSLNGHNFGNLFLTALTNIYGSEAEAIRLASEILAIQGKVLPVTTDNVDLVALYDNGEVLYGEKNIDDPDPKTHDCTSRVTKLWTQPQSHVYTEAEKSILTADYVILGPGDLYSSLLSNLVVAGMPEVILNSKAKLIYIHNLVNKYGQTHGYKHSDYFNEVFRYSRKQPDYLVVNSKSLPDDVLANYAKEKSFPIIDDLDSALVGVESKVIRADLLANELHKKIAGDKVKRSLIRHDSKKLGRVLLDIFSQQN